MAAGRKPRKDRNPTNALQFLAPSLLVMLLLFKPVSTRYYARLKLKRSATVRVQTKNDNKNSKEILEVVGGQSPVARKEHTACAP